MSHEEEVQQLIRWLDSGELSINTPWARSALIRTLKWVRKERTTMRDQLARAVLQNASLVGGQEPGEIGAKCYEIADAVLEARDIAKRRNRPEETQS